MEKTYMIRLYNTLSRKKELLKPIRNDWVGLYTCGPTVYNFVHIGNLRTYIFEDILRRTLEYSGYTVRHVMNITDVEDKIIRDAKAAGKNIIDFTRPYERAFLEDIQKLHIERAWKYPRATEHISEMIGLIQLLLARGIAYQADGSIYFSISKFKKYGRLSRLASRQLKKGARVDVDEYAKDSAEDFVLWKAAKDGEPSWDAPFGKGRPGWHIECSAMAMKYLGESFDLHAGGVDLIFPHHENEIAQSEGATGKQFARFFLEGEHLLVSGEKMAKSLGNFFTLRDLEEKHINPLAFRYLVLTSHYRSTLNFTWESLEASQKSLERIYDFVRELQLAQKITTSNTLVKYAKEFETAVSDDLNTPKALAVVWKLVHDYNKAPKKYNPKEMLKLLYDFDRVLGLDLKGIKIEKIPAEIHALVAQREQYRKEKKWKEADVVRSQIENRGYILEDSPSGPKIKKK